MSATIDYFFAPQSPWVYLGHRRFVDLARRAGAAVRVRPMDLGAKVFPVSGGLPLPQRAPQRQAYRLVELDRFRRFLGLPMNVKPRFFPVAADPAARLIVATDREQGSAAALELTGRILTACWAEERDIASAETLSALLAESGLEASLLAASTTPEVQATYDAHTQAAIEAGVFGAPSYVIDGEIFWGQDRLDFVARRLLQG
jgi:2-hydroxychromene-2-carboxylate isomerase